MIGTKDKAGTHYSLFACTPWKHIGRPGRKQTVEKENFSRKVLMYVSGSCASFKHAHCSELGEKEDRNLYD